MWELTLPQLNYYLKKCKKHVEFTIRVQSNPLAGMFGTGSMPATGAEKDPNKEYEGEYEVASEEDMEWLASIM